ncbi:dihydrolipoamide acetyltransferase [Helicobacter pylori]|nr:dihydrolipoamide acetyltransferase [Helicobacter pylori]
MVTPLKSLRLPIGHPLVEILCELSLKKDKPAFNEESPINFKKEVSEENKIKFKQALRVLHAIVSNEASLRYLSDENQKFIEDLKQAEKITKELVEKTLEIVSYSDVDVDFEEFKNKMLNVDNEAVISIKSYAKDDLIGLNGGHWDLDVPSSSKAKESVTFRFDNLPKDHNEKEVNFYARSSLKDLKRNGVVAIDFGTKSTTAIYMNDNGRYCLLSIGGDVDAVAQKSMKTPR